MDKPIAPRPTPQAVTDYLLQWEKLPNYPEQEAAPSLLFHQTYPSNKALSEVLIKCAALNDFYGTNIFSVCPLAAHITSLDMDARLAAGDPALVHDIASGHGIVSKSGKELCFFSFATKYCSHHNEHAFPIFDSYVEKVLLHYRNADRFTAFRNNELRNFPTFKRVILDFQQAYQLDAFSLKQIDKYLWLLGKKLFPKRF